MTGTTTERIGSALSVASQLIGRTISHYTITAKIGEGGMGVVYKAIDTRLNRTIAFKVLGAAYEADADRKRRFIEEAKAASALNHPNIVAVYDVDRVDDVDFIAMEYVPGRTLDERIGTKGMPISEVVGYLSQVADALSAAHAAGIVHRDLKPANIIVGDSGIVKLVDFGLAKLTEPAVTAAAAPTMTAQVALTGPNTVIGTAAYMSPEQARGALVDQRADVWAFGCVLYECLTGRRAFAGHSHVDVVARILETEPDLSALPATTPQSLRDLIRACLRKDLKARLRFVDPALLHLSSELGTPIAPPHPLWKNISIGLASVLVVATGWWIYSRRPIEPVAPERVVRFEVPFETSSLAREWNFPLLAIAPDGSSLVYANTASRRTLQLRRMERGTTVELAGTEGATSPFYSPDGRWVGFFVGDALKKVSIPEGVVQTVAGGLRTVTAAYGAAWAPDDTILFPAPAFKGGLQRVAAAGGTPVTISHLGPGEIAHRWPSISPDGSVVVYTTSNSTGPGLEEPHVVAQSLVSGKRSILPVQATFAKFAPDGRRLLLVGGGILTTVAFDPSTLSVSGSPIPMMDGVLQASTGAAQIDVSRAVLTFLKGAAETRRLVWVDRRGQVTPLEAPPRLYAHPRLSPDGNTIAVTITEPKNDIWTYDIARGTLSRLTTEGTSNAYPIWTPDGTRITYVSSQNGKPQNVFWKLADGTGAEERLVTSDNPQVSETWVHDGKTLVFVELRPGPTGWDILTLPMSPPRQPAPFLESPYCDCTPQISPSGRYLAHTSDESGRQEVQIRSFPSPGAKVTVSTGGASAAWRGDESEIYYVSGNAMMAASVKPGPPLVVGKPQELFRGDFAAIQGKNYDVTRDGQRFLMVRTDEREPPKEISVVLNWLADFEPFRQSNLTR